MSLPQDLKETLTFILAGGQGERLKPLTINRSKPAVPFGGAYRIIDFTLSNCIHSGLRRIFVLTQYQARSLEEHIRFGWNFLPRRLEQFISVSPPHHATVGEWYVGTADAIYKNLDLLQEERAAQVLILSGDHIYKMNYGAMLEEHIEKKAALTIGAVRIPAEESRRFGVLEVDAKNQVVSFAEKPKVGKEIPGMPGQCLGSMGIYIFDTKELIRRLRADAELGAQSSHDFGKDVIPRMIGEVPVHAHHFVDMDKGAEPYWRDVGTLDAYYESSMDLCSIKPNFNLYDSKWPIYSLWHADPPAKTVLDEDGRRAEVVDSLLCAGTVVSGGRVKRSILSNRCLVQENAIVEDSILFGGVTVRPGAKIRRAILDKWTEVPSGETIGYDLELDKKRFTVTPEGIVVVPMRYPFAGSAPRTDVNMNFPRPGE
ncbi:MAG: glucose-1-phosphate adenylyltransferase [Planctomycetes bacterium]|nr:glucose-1-phosphate adenylyltransferase [Planctomycetota bacterium]